MLRATGEADTPGDCSACLLSDCVLRTEKGLKMKLQKKTQQQASIEQQRSGFTIVELLVAVRRYRYSDGTSAAGNSIGTRVWPENSVHE